MTTAENIVFVGSVFDGAVRMGTDGVEGPNLAFRRADYQARLASKIER
jgi:hypothetical protein